MKFGRILTLAAVVLSTPALAANLTFNSNIELAVVNGQKHNQESVFGRPKDVVLPEGEQQIVFRIYDSFRTPGGHEMYGSEYYVATFADQGDETIKLTSANLPNLKAAKKFDDNPEFKLTNSKGEAVPFTLAQLKKEGMQISRDLVNELREFNATGHEGAIESRAPFAALAMMNNESTSLPKEGGVQTRIGDVLMSEQMLHYWFQQADHDTRVRFMEWADRSMKRSMKESAAK
ncbi:DUF2057 domain-containing protein [Parendozoicomonas haliclonae]|uniref:UPF0319 protein EHSB41UT_02049 n=1 Tax=Parendozoicomonas haliclonae TaxID=1960125 RepID=A0A1X7AIZ6_9GAMM|nr:DUF2057 domain-containing protein [Parendozoicomonas haliclonae]SMA45971.1 hypothetical protein EHSB41UT_02049 [Parendozoicomonas haliclonae]